MQSAQDEPPTEPPAVAPSEALSYLEQAMKCISDVYEEERHLVEFPGIVDSFICLSDAAKLFFFRLLGRKHVWIPQTALNREKYGENMDETIHELAQAELCDSRGPSTAEDWLELLRKDELKLLVSELKLGAATMKLAELKRVLAEYLRHGSYFDADGAWRQKIVERIKSTVGKVVRQSSTARYQFQCLFLIQKRLRMWPDDDSFLVDSILSNLPDGDSRKRHFVKNNQPRCGLVWPTLVDFKQYIEALQLEAVCRQRLEANTAAAWEQVLELYTDVKQQWKDAVQNAPEDGHVTGIKWFATFTHGHVLTRIMHLVYGAIFRLKRHHDAVELLRLLLGQRVYLFSRRGSWYDELVRLLERYVDKAQAKAACLEALSDAWVVSHHRSSVLKRLQRICQGKAQPAVLWHTKAAARIPQETIVGTRVPSAGNHVLILGKNASPLTVEEFTLEHFAATGGWKGYHAENSVLTTMFGLLFFDIIFDASIPGVFASNFQSSPLDMQTEFFYESRKELIDARLHDIRQGNAGSILAAISERERHKETICVGVNWSRFSTQDTVEIAECIGPEPLAGICQLYAKQYWAHQGGV
ncbi:hypothetical protein HDU91_006311, partial [Kappamyces sp. JEL0680]